MIPTDPAYVENSHKRGRVQSTFPPVLERFVKTSEQVPVGGLCLRKAGYQITVEKVEGGKPTRYRIFAEPPPAEGDAASSR
ncbi:hypothetical protein P6F26_05395 [Roseibacterium sp. SDUM158017]|uniref:hypothetical protein n=1 Tax=Roseicyclus salinarum TaxID=3036773 RepID=UPI0024156C44|nr:hypothetical protein [Roseibacterium sp. SDUM158017]MDG4647870.1 hypothetical protein [Roseibacterium sp. SDUM158017]